MALAQQATTPESLKVFIYDVPSRAADRGVLTLDLETVAERPTTGYWIAALPHRSGDTLLILVEGVDPPSAFGNLVSPAYFSMALPSPLARALTLVIVQREHRDVYRLIVDEHWALLQPLLTDLTTAPVRRVARIRLHSALVDCVPAGWPAGVCRALSRAAGRRHLIALEEPLPGPEVELRPFELPQQRWTDADSSTRTLVLRTDSIPVDSLVAFARSYTDLFGGYSGILITIRLSAGAIITCYQGECR